MKLTVQFFFMLKILILGAFLVACQSEVTYQKNQLWYDEPATEWLEALPLGNGQLGAMVFGGVNQEKLYLNEESLWAGASEDPYPENVGEHYRKFQQLNLHGHYDQAFEYGVEHLAVLPTAFRSYEPLGKLFLTFDHKGAPESYVRRLDLETGILTVEYEVTGKRFRREAFVSADHGVLVYHFESLDGEPLATQVDFQRDKDVLLEVLNTNIIEVRGQVFDDPEGYDDNRGGSGQGGLHMKFFSHIGILDNNGEQGVLGNNLSIRNSTSFTLVASAATDYNIGKMNFDRAIDARKNSFDKLQSVLQLSYDEIRAIHITEHSEIFNRVKLEIESESLDSLSTGERLARVSTA
ncbi:glycoside hydrolase family 95 protein [Chondrinema litorale]|uniref:glycoside hydrolase family 95 protein n=1 Tax=Chondrinema litorale TaxID=2994555 RepID=UPI002543E218|nr:glycoside hydrolase family 95 protein [Chondrinema litorale]UZR98479.1 glycoside hydrolase family 95 protein [Chondrinema litorale]